MDEQHRAWVEAFGLWADAMGMPRSTGRVLGWLLVCDPPEQSAADLAEGLQASTGSVSTATRQLAASGLVERVAVRGDRRTYHRVTPDTISGLMQAEVARIAAMRAVGEEGLAALGDAAAGAQGSRLRTWTDMARFFEREWPVLLADWEQERA